MRPLVTVVRRLILRNPRTVVIDPDQDGLTHAALSDFTRGGDVGTPRTERPARIEHVLSIMEINDRITARQILIVTARQINVHGPAWNTGSSGVDEVSQDTRRGKRGWRLIGKHISIFQFEDVETGQVIAAARRIVPMIISVIADELDQLAGCADAADLKERFARGPAGSEPRHRRGDKVCSIPVKEVCRAPTTQIINRFPRIRRSRLCRHGLSKNLGQINHVGRITPTALHGRSFEVTVLQLGASLNSDLAEPNVARGKPQLDRMCDIPGAKVRMIPDHEHAISGAGIRRNREIDDLLVRTRCLTA